MIVVFDTSSLAPAIIPISQSRRLINRLVARTPGVATDMISCRTATPPSPASSQYCPHGGPVRTDELEGHGDQLVDALRHAGQME